VNSPGADDREGGGAGVAAGGAENVGPCAAGADTGSFSAPNICVKLPGDDGAAAGGAGGGAAGGFSGAANRPDGPAASGFFSMATCTNALASSRDAFSGGLATSPVGLPGVFNACSMRVNSPGFGADGSAGGGGAAGVVNGSRAAAAGGKSGSR